MILNSNFWIFTSVLPAKIYNYINLTEHSKTIWNEIINNGIFMRFFLLKKRTSQEQNAAMCSTLARETREKAGGLLSYMPNNKATSLLFHNLLVKYKPITQRFAAFTVKSQFKKNSDKLEKPCLKSLTMLQTVLLFKHR